MQIDLIKPYDKNAKKHPEKQVQQIADSIKAFGFNQPIVLDKNNVVIVGHGRLEAAKLLGLTDVPTITVDLTEEQAKAYRLADNKLNESEWDMGLVIEELKGLSAEMSNLVSFDNVLLEIEGKKPNELWQNMPEFQPKGEGNFKDLVVHFEDELAVGEFAELVGQKITNDTKYIYYPLKKNEI